MDANATNPPQQRLVVRVWFGHHTIADYTASPAMTERYAEAMRRRFASLRVTVDPITSPMNAGQP